MATITINGQPNGTRVILKPGKPPRILSAAWELQGIKGELESLRHGFVKIDLNNESLVGKLCEDIQELRLRYSQLLSKYKTILEEHMKTTPEGEQIEYAAVIAFLERAGNTHTILAYEKYLEQVFMINDCSEPPVPLVSLEHMIALSEDKMAESILMCSTYLAILSGALGEQMRFFRLDEMVSGIFALQRETSIFNRYIRTCGNQKDEHELRRMHEENAKIVIESAGSPYGLPLITRFMITQLINNAFKASFGAYACQNYQRYVLTANGNPIPNVLAPQVTVSVRRNSRDFISVKINDNGIGMGSEELAHIFEQKQRSGFEEIQVSNHSSLAVFPYLANLTQTEIRVTSQGLGMGFEAELIIPIELSDAAGRYL